MTQKILLIALLLFGCSIHAMTTSEAMQACQTVLAELSSTITLHQEQHNDALNQIKADIKKMQNMLEIQNVQNQKDQETIADLREQLTSMEQQKNKEIAALQEQLAQSAFELELLENEYDNFIDACLAYEQDLYNTLLLIKKEYMGLLDDQDHFFEKIELILEKVQKQEEDMTTEVYDALENVTQASN